MKIDYFNGQECLKGLKTPPATFQRIINQMLEKYIGKICHVYLDDIIVYEDSEKQHDTNFNKILRTLQENKVKINLQKLQFEQKQVKLL